MDCDTREQGVIMTEQKYCHQLPNSTDNKEYILGILLCWFKYICKPYWALKRNLLTDILYLQYFIITRG